MLDGAVVPGNHEPLISKELFLKIHGILETNTHGYTVKEENEHLPLKRFFRCEKCGQFLHGYIVKKTNIHYYKCSTFGCGTNRNANVLNQRFAEVLEYFRLDTAPDVLELIKLQAIATFNQYTQDYKDEYVVLQQKQQELTKKIARLEERLIAEELPSELYYKYVAKYNEEKEVIEEAIAKATVHVSNLDECIDSAIDFAVNLPKKRLSASYHIKQRLQFLLFPEEISYNRENDMSRTSRVNSVFLYLAYLKQFILKQERGILALQLNYASLSRSVAPIGLELGLKCYSS